MSTITGTEIQDMVRHWLDVPINGYLGSSYGSELRSLLQRPMADGAPEAFLNKLRGDVPVLSVLPENDLSLYAERVDPDKLNLLIAVAGQGIEIPG